MALTFSGQVLACKRIKLKNRTIVDAVRREISLLISLSGCRNVVQWCDDISVSPLDLTVHLHMAYYNDGDLEGAISKKEAARSAPPFA